jgi:hypothetical protein
VQKLAFNLPLNSTSLGQVSLSILRELYNKKLEINLFPIGGVDISSQSEDPEFFKWINNSISQSVKTHSRKNPIFKLWHLNGSLESFSDNQVLLSFYEVDSPTNTEINIIKNNSKVLFSNNYSVNTFKTFGSHNVDYLPLAFDSNHFKNLGNKPKKEGIQFGLFGKLEPQRKRHLKIITNWAKKYGNKHGYFLNCAIFNHFLDVNVQSQILNQALNGQTYWNINFLPYMQSNLAYNDLLNNTDIVLAMSGGEGWGLPEFQSVALGKHAIVLNSHGYKEWANENNSVLINPNGKIPCYDNIFFHQGADFNQGNIFDWNDEDFLNGLDIVESKFKLNNINTEGLKLQNEFTYTKMVDSILNYLTKL